MKTSKIAGQKTMILFPGYDAQIFPGEQLMMMHIMVQPGATASVHSHPHEQMSVVLRGEIEFTVDGEKKVLMAGEVLSIPSHAVHSATAITETELYEFFTPVREDLIERYSK